MSQQDSPQFVVGIDWAATEHAVCVLDRNGCKVAALLQTGNPVLPVKPNAIETWREAEVLSDAKIDPGDAEVIALTKYPTAASAVSLTEKRLAAFRANQGCSGKTALNTAIKTLNRSIAEKMDAHPDEKIFRTFPRAGILNATRILART